MCFITQLLENQSKLLCVSVCHARSMQIIMCMPMHYKLKYMHSLSSNNPQFSRRSKKVPSNDFKLDVKLFR